MHVVRTWESETNVATLQDVHPDQLCSLWTTANLVLEKILRLKGKMSTGRLVKHFLLHDQFFSPALSNTTVQELIFSASQVYTYRTLFSNWVPHPGPLQTANLPVESCRALESCNTQHFHKFVAKNDLTFGKRHSEVYHLSHQRQSFSYCCLYQISFLFNEGLLAVVILTWHDALVHQLLPGSPLLKPQLQDWKKKEKCVIKLKMRHI